MVLTESILVNNPCYKEGKKIKVQGLMLEGVRCPQPSARVFVHNWNRENCDNKCVHAFIDANDGHVIQTLPWNHRGRHCGKHPRTKMSANGTHIGIKMCEPSQIRYKTKNEIILAGDKEKAISAVKRTYNTAVELFAKLCKDFDLDPKKAIISQKEGYDQGIAALHNDPELLWKVLGLNYTMEGFRQDVMLALSEQAVISNSESNPHQVKNSNIQEVEKEVKTEEVPAALIQKADEPEVKTEEIPLPLSQKVDELEVKTEEVPASLIQKADEPEVKIEEMAAPLIEELAPTKTIKVKVDVDSLRIRSTPGIGNNTTGKYTGRGIFEIIEIQNGNGSKKGWGKLSSGAGWISLDFVEIL